MPDGAGKSEPKAQRSESVRRWSMKSILILMCLASTAAAQVRTVKPQEPPAPKPSKAAMKTPATEGAKIDVRTGAEIGYDDNILDLSRKQLDELEGGQDTHKFRIDEPGDVVYSAWIDARVKGRTLFKEPTAAGLKVQPYVYQDSSIANYEEYKLFAKQDFAAHEAGVEVGLERDVYLRELKVEEVNNGPNLFDSAFYDEWDLSTYYQHRLHSRVTLRGTIGWLIRDYESPFGYRDREGLYVALKPEVDLGHGFSAFVRYEYADQEADPGALDPDTSYLQHEIQMGLGVELLQKKLGFSLAYKLGFREYTSTQDPVLVDPSHVDREDRRQRIELAARWKVAKGWALEARYEWKDVDSDRPFDDEGTTSEPGDSTRNIVTFGVSLAL
jgi:hypothetical protein